MTNPKRSALGIELGSTRIKAITVDKNHVPISMGDYTWKSDFRNGIWTYDLQEAFTGLRAALREITCRENIEVMGISGMMHGYLAFDKNWNLLVPFRTWQNTITADAAKELTERFHFNIPQRWSIAHLYQAVLGQEPHVSRIAHITTLAGWVHFMLTGVNAVGIGEASGIFPIDSEKLSYDEQMLSKMDLLLKQKDINWDIRQILPQVLPAGADAGALTEEGAALLDGLLPVGIPFAPPEGDAGTGMTATNAVTPGTGNVSAGTSIFAMVVLKKALKNVYEEIDLVTTPAGSPVALVHCNNCTNDTNAWVTLLHEAASFFGAEVSMGEAFSKLYLHSLEGEADCGGITVCNYMAGEGITHMDAGRPLVIRKPDARFTLANFFRAQLYSTMATLKLGMDVLSREHVAIDRLTGHGGLFKTPGVGQKYMAAACGTPVTCMKTAGEGGPYGMALLASYRLWKTPGESLEAYLQDRVFAHSESTTITPDPETENGFQTYLEQFTAMLPVEKAAIHYL